ncbi:hypothetical protein [uncultured Desulfuromonas sp.]|nr:hypothetical protein [uncultured Desulfuromonas sp.]
MSQLQSLGDWTFADHGHDPGFLQFLFWQLTVYRRIAAQKNAAA